MQLHVVCTCPAWRDAICCFLAANKATGDVGIHLGLKMFWETVPAQKMKLQMGMVTLRIGIMHARVALCLRSCRTPVLRVSSTAQKPLAGDRSSVFLLIDVDWFNDRLMMTLEFNRIQLRSLLPKNRQLFGRTVTGSKASLPCIICFWTLPAWAFISWPRIAPKNTVRWEQHTGHRLAHLFFQNVFWFFLRQAGGKVWELAQTYQRLKQLNTCSATVIGPVASFQSRAVLMLLSATCRYRCRTGECQIGTWDA